MTNSNKFIDKLNELIEYAVKQRPLHDYEEACNPLKSAVEQFFKRDRTSLKQALHELQIALMCDITNRNTVYKDPPVELTYANDFPPAYNDLRKLFYEFPLLDCENDKFFDAFTYEWTDIDKDTDMSNIYWRAVEYTETKNDDGETEITYGDVVSSWDNPREITVSKYQYQKEIVSGNSLSTKWINDMEESGNKELSSINALKTWLQNASSDAYSLRLWENMGKTSKSPTTVEIAKIVFEDKKLKECKEIYNLPIHIPTYL